MRTRKRKNGKLEIQKRADAADNAKPKKVFVTHGAGSNALLRDPLDRRTRVGKAYHAHKQALRAHIGGDPTLPQEELIDQAARLSLLTNIAWGELIRSGELIVDGDLHPAFDAYLKAARDQRSVLDTLGLKRHSKELRLQDVLNGEVQHEA